MKFGIFYEHLLPRPWEESPDPTIAAISAGLILSRSWSCWPPIASWGCVASPTS